MPLEKCTTRSAQYGAGIASLPDPAAPFPESTAQLPLSPYGVSKAAMELLGRQYGRNFGLPIVYARLFPQVGVGQSEELALQSFARQVALAESGVPTNDAFLQAALRAKKQLVKISINNIVNNYRQLGNPFLLLLIIVS